MIYIHIPFCGSFCTYCGFYSEIADREVAGRYVKALCTEISSREKELAEGPDTLYIGGGTPSVLPLSAVMEIASAAGGAALAGIPLSQRHFREFTFEANPEDIAGRGRAYAEGLAACGVNRISMGVQSFDDGILRWMNRRHSAGTAVKAYDIIRESGIENVSIDLIFGISQMDDDLWNDTLDKAVALRPQHISAYQLSIEPESTLASMVRTGRYREASEPVCRRQYDMLCRKLSEAGYRHYEISNFALPGYEALHNSSYWRHVPYAGFGPGAHSFSIGGDTALSGTLRKYMRFWNIPDVRKYISYYSQDNVSGHAGTLEAAVDAGVKQFEELTPEQTAIERIMLGLRTDTGVERTFLAAHTDRSGLEKMVGGGFLVPASDPSFLRIPEKHFFISDSIIADII